MCVHDDIRLALPEPHEPIHRHGNSLEGAVINWAYQCSWSNLFMSRGCVGFTLLTSSLSRFVIMTSVTSIFFCWGGGGGGGGQTKCTLSIMKNYVRNPKCEFCPSARTLLEEVKIQ